MVDIVVLKTEGASAPEAEEGEASAQSLIFGEYRTRTWNHWAGEDGRLFCGIWECTPGKMAASISPGRRRTWSTCRSEAPE